MEKGESVVVAILRDGNKGADAGADVAVRDGTIGNEAVIGREPDDAAVATAGSATKRSSLGVGAEGP